jgi:glyoxylase-like metal-dependent hydrolase (beta-lactamase superfamily II)
VLNKLLVAVLLVGLLVTVGVSQRHFLLAHGMALAGVPELDPPTDEGPRVRWADDYFTVQSLDERTFAIGEPRYYQQVFSYLIEGSERAILFDAGPGHRDIRAIAETLTDLPITFVPSHFHFDHVGNRITFDRVAVLDLPYLRERAPDGRLRLTFAEHLGVAEGIEAPTLEVDEWLAPGSLVSLGERDLRVLYTPGHTEDSISLLDVESGDLFTGDFIYPGPLFAFLANSGMGDYQQAADTVLTSVPSSARLFGAHRIAPPGAPQLGIEDVRDLQAALHSIDEGELEGVGFYPVVYPVNDRMELYAEPGWLQEWTPRHPELR